MRFPKKPGPARSDDKRTGPRDAPNYQPRGRKRLGCWTWETVAQILGVTVYTAMRYGQGKDRKFDPCDLADILRYAQERAGRRPK